MSLKVNLFVCIQTTMEDACCWESKKRAYRVLNLAFRGDDVLLKNVDDVACSCISAGVKLFLIRQLSLALPYALTLSALCVVIQKNTLSMRWSVKRSSYSLSLASVRLFDII